MVYATTVTRVSFLSCRINAVERVQNAAEQLSTWFHIHSDTITHRGVSPYPTVGAFSMMYQWSLASCKRPAAIMCHASHSFYTLIVNINGFAQPHPHLCSRRAFTFTSFRIKTWAVVYRHNYALFSCLIRLFDLMVFRFARLGFLPVLSITLI